MTGWTRHVGLLAGQAFAGSRYTGGDVWRAAAEAGAEWVSVTEEAFGMPAERLKQLRADIDAAGLPVLQTGCPAFGLSDPRDAVRDFNLEWAKRQVDFTVDLGARRMKILLGEWTWRGMWPNDLQWRMEIEAVRRLSAHAEQRGVVLSIELEPLPGSYVNDPTSLARVLAQVDSPVLQANIDTSHMVVMASPAEDIRLVRGRVNTIDFSDSNGKWHEHLEPGAGVADLAAFAGELVAAGQPETLLAVEVGPFGDPDHAYERVVTAIDRTRTLFAGAVPDHG
jgi:D-psicose/D-tagatose/L-ribulose 3-epimerase